MHDAAWSRRKERAMGGGGNAMGDRYKNFAALSAGEILHVDYLIRLDDRDSEIAAIAPHGGLIEPVTSLIAETIAENRLSFYAFEGLRRRPHRELHITSENFDEPQCLALLATTKHAVTIHGRGDDDDGATVWLGGSAQATRNAVATALRASGFAAITSGHRLAGVAASNICNRCQSGSGVQLEIPRSLRAQLEKDATRLQAFCGAVRSALPSEAQI